MTIFVSISSYCDPQLIPTIMDCVAKAYCPAALHIVVCWQHEPGEEDPNKLNVVPASLSIIDIPNMESRGCCWARSLIQELYSGEDWYLQLDSHHRFAQNWDVELLWQAAHSGSAKPVISCYCAPYTVGPPETLDSPIPEVLMLTRITPDGVILCRGGLCDSWLNEPNKPPSRARFVSGHLLFAPGSFVKDVPYDPLLYFTGEEITLATRAFTHGYDLFHPSRHIVWHEYTRAYRSKHWDHHTEWYVGNTISEHRVLKLLAEWPIGQYEFGNVRSKADYEAYTGLNFTTWTASDAAFRGEEPPPVTG